MNALDSIHLRPVQAGDEPFLREVYSSTREGELARVPWDGAQKEAFLAMQFDAQHRHYQLHYPKADYLVIESEGKPAGRLYVARMPAEFRIIDIALLPQHRGHGIGTQLLGDLLEEAASAHLPVRIHVERTNPALRLYRRLGFEVLSEGPIYLLMEKKC